MMAFMTPILQAITLLSSMLAVAPYLTLSFPTHPPFEGQGLCLLSCYCYLHFTDEQRNHIK